MKRVSSKWFGILFSVTVSSVSAQQFSPDVKVAYGPISYGTGALFKSYSSEAAKALTQMLYTTETVQKSFAHDLIERLLAELKIHDRENREVVQRACERYFEGRIQRDPKQEKKAEDELRAAAMVQSRVSEGHAKIILTSFFARVRQYVIATQKITEKAIERGIGGLVKEAFFTGVPRPGSADFIKELMAAYEAGSRLSLVTKLGDSPYGEATLVPRFDSELMRTSGTASACGPHDHFCFYTRPYRAEPVSLYELPQFFFLMPSLRLVTIMMSILATKFVLWASHGAAHSVLFSLLGEQVKGVLSASGAAYAVYLVANKVVEKLVETYGGGLMMWYNREFFYARVHEVIEALTGRKMTIAEEVALRNEADWWERLAFAYESGAFGAQLDFTLATAKSLTS